MHHAAVHQAISAVWRQESARIVATVLRRVRDLALAEELAQDALIAALEHWPRQGLPANPAAWLMTTAQHRALDHLRHAQMAQARHEDIAADRSARGADLVPDIAEALDDTREGLADDVLRLMFVACHPLLAPEARVALTLRLVGGLSTQEIARAHLVPEATVAQRIVRAQRTLSQAGLTFEVPRGPDRAARLASVLAVVYAIFNEGHNASAGDDWMRPSLCDEAMRLARLLATLAPHEPEALGLLALLELTAARAPARQDAEGRPVLLEQQDRRLWNTTLLQRGLAVLAQAQALEDELPEAATGAYVLQAAIAACHARAATTAATDWPAIAALYERLAAAAPSPVVQLNRAVAVSRAEGPAAGLQVLAPLLHEPVMKAYPWLPAVQGDLLAQLGRCAEARACFERAAELAGNTPDRALMQARAAALAGPGPAT
ncbi:RNA polymerase subunit sigma-24 [beta proteobacterium AAP121]|nr:RNA polymerase subunit sigma-24 [beta proteobacterium AAP65]KPF95425.1 RNA polymerase subunit sigma-24 [beta proteobacterium AAP121]